ncbi:hypothetical protein [Kitasatospora sp. NPDC058046]|uniref:hypothetical protein n=1 Tax=Kitasatospora sp. NPDC058046 TaxID=3346312 RepID=UPI0036D91FB0
MTATDDTTPGQTAYTAYGEATAGLNFLGEPMPTWDGLSDVQRTAWNAAATAVTLANASRIDAIAQTMRAGEGPYPEEWTSRDIRDAVQAAATNLRATARLTARAVVQIRPEAQL